MKKLYLLFLMSVIAFLGFGQRIYCESDMRFYDVNEDIVKKSATIYQGNNTLSEITSSGDTVWAGVQNSPYVASQTRGYFFQAQSTFNIVAVMCAEEGNPSATMQSVEIVSFGSSVPIAYPGPGSPHTVLFSALNVASGWVDCNVELVQGNYYGIIGAKNDPGGSTMYNSYGNAQNLVIDGISTYCARLVLQSPLSAGSPASGEYMTEPSYAVIGRVHFITESGCIDDIVQDNDPGECGAVVTYDQPSAWDTATVTQIDGSSLTSGDLFPVDTTIQSYRIDYGGGDVDTCTFSVIVKDVEAPVALCKDITLELDSTGHASLSSGSGVIYFAGTFGNSVWKYDGNSVTELYHPAAYDTNGPVGVRFVKENDMLYFTGGNYSEVYSAKADGSGTPVALPNSQFGSEHHDLAIDYANGRYFFGASGVHVANLDGSGTATDLSTSFDCDEVPGIDYDPVGKKVYFSNLRYGCISSLNDDGTDYTVLFDASDGVDRPRDVAIDVANSLIYWTNLTTGTIMSGNLDGTGTPVVLYTALPRGSSIGTFGLYLSGSTLYWTTFNGNDDPYDDRIYKASADGSGTPELVVQGSFGGIRGLFVDGISINNGSSDNCGLLSLESSKTDFTYSDIGDNLVTLTVTDVHGNVSTCTSIVTVTGDVIPPTVSCRPLKVYLDRSGAYTLTGEDIAYIATGTTDDVTAFEDLDIQVTPNVFGCDSVGEVSVLVTATDEAGNIDSCETVVTVINKFEISPFPVSDITVELPEGVCETKVEYPYIGSFTPCVTFTQLEGLGPAGHFPAGATTEVWQAINTSGDTLLISFTVTVVAVGTEPTLAAIDDVETDEDTPVSVTLTGIGNGGGCDMDSVILTVSGYDNALFAEVTLNYANGDTTGTIDFIPNENQFGTSGITVEVTDGEGLVTMQSFTVTVMPVNDAPILVQPLPDVTLIAKDTVEIDISKQLGTMFDDIDDTTLTITIDFNGDTLPSWIAVSEDQYLYSLVATPLQADTGCYSIIVTATDLAGAMVADTFELCVDKLVGIQNISDQLFDITMYPNPTNAKVNIDMISSAGDIEVMVMNIAGAEVYRKVFKQSEAIRFDLSDNVSGMYLVRVKTGDKQVVKKLILDRK